MRAARIHELGGPLILEDVPVPEPGPGQLLVRVRACGVNFADTLIVKGEYQEKVAPPFAPGMEIAGEVVALGPGAAGPAPGTAVAGLTGHGGFAEFALLPAAGALPVPPGMSMTDAAAFAIAYGTSHLALSHRAGLRAGETLLVLGAAGGVGLTAVEIGKLMGARVIAVARGAEKLAVAAARGADHLLDSDGTDLREAVKALGGADVVYDPVGGEPFLAALRAARPEARLLIIGFASGSIPQIPANLLLVKNLTAIGFYWGAYQNLRPDLLRGSLATLLGWYGEGRLRPHVSHVVPLSEAGRALDLLRGRAATGKVVIVPEEPAPTAGPPA